MYVKQMYAGWIGITLGDKVTSGVGLWKATAKVREQLLPVTPTHRQKLTLLNDLRRYQTADLIPFIEAIEKDL